MNDFHEDPVAAAGVDRDWSGVPVTVNITDVFADTVRVPVETVKPGDTVFDIWGGKHTVTRTRVFKSRTRIWRDDQTDYSSFETGSTITIVRGAS